VGNAEATWCRGLSKVDSRRSEVNNARTPITSRKHVLSEAEGGITEGFGNNATRVAIAGFLRGGAAVKAERKMVMAVKRRGIQVEEVRGNHLHIEKSADQ